MSYTEHSRNRQRRATDTSSDTDDRISEKILQVRQERGRCKASLIKKIKEIQSLLLEQADSNMVEKGLQALKQIFSRFHGKCVQYTALIESDPDEIRCACEYFESEKQSFNRFISAVTDYLGQKQTSSEQYETLDEIRPENSVSQVRSGTSFTSSITSALVKARAKKAMQLARAESLKKHSIRIRQLQLQQEEEDVEIQAEIAVTEVAEQIYSEYDFIESAAQEINDPIFGTTEGLGKTGHKIETEHRGRGSNPGRNFSTSFNIHATGDALSKIDSNPRFPCHLCSGDHVLSRCSSFQQKKPGKRLDFVRTKKLCFICFSSKHMSDTCTKEPNGSVHGCSKKHDKLFHVDFEPNRRSVEQITVTQKAETGNVIVNSFTCNTPTPSMTRVVLPIVAVKVRARKDAPYVDTYALLDTGSTNSFCSKSLANTLGLEGTKPTLTLTTLGNENKSDTVMTFLEAADIIGRNLIRLPHVFSVSELPDLTANVVDPQNLDRWKHLDGITFPHVNGGNISLLIGQDMPAALIPYEVRMGTENEPYATRTMFGWTLNGSLHIPSSHGAVSNFVQTDHNLQSQVEKFWRVETCESGSDDTTSLSLEDKMALGIWEQSTVMVDGHYQMDIHFRNSEPALPNNYMVARSRLDSLKRKLEQQPDLFERYRTEIRSLQDKGYAEKVPPKDLDSSEGKTWYLPHHGVTSVSKPDKLRIVFDCSVKYMGSSLNDQVLQGPDMTHSMIRILLRFREHPIAVMAESKVCSTKSRSRPQTETS